MVTFKIDSWKDFWATGTVLGIEKHAVSAAQRLSSPMRQHVPLHLLPEDSGARADRPIRGRPRKSPETEDLVPEVAIIAEETLSEANETDSAAQGPVPLTAVASGMSLAAADVANQLVVDDHDALLASGLVGGTAGRADVEQSTLRPSLPRACKKSRNPLVQLTGKPKGKPKPPSEHERVPATKEATPVVPASGTRVVEGQSTRASSPPACKMTAKRPSCEKPEKKPSDYQSAVARHLADHENKGWALAYSDNSFRVVRVCPLTANQEIMEALYIKALAPNLCVQKSSIAHLTQLFRHRSHHVIVILFFTPLALLVNVHPNCRPFFLTLTSVFLCLSLCRTCINVLVLFSLSIICPVLSWREGHENVRKEWTTEVWDCVFFDP